MKVVFASVAGLRVELRLHAPAPDALARWVPFHTDPGPADVSIDLLPQRPGGGRLTGKIVERGGRWRAGGCEEHGWLDPATGTGEAPCSPGLAIAEKLLQAALARHVATRGGVLLHAAALRVNGWCHLAPGHSGAGKSTLARLAGHPLADEVAIVVPGCDGAPPVVHATPWWRSAGGSAPLARIHALAWGAPSVTPAPGPGRLRHVAQALVLPLDEPMERARAFAACAAIAGAVPFSRLSFAPDTDVDALLRDHMARRAA